MKFIFQENRYSLLISLISIGILAALMVVLLFFDSPISHWALSKKVLAENEESALGEFFQIVRVFGKADVLVLLAIILGLAGKRRICKRIIISLILVGILVHPVKNIVGRERPDHTSHTSFPSGDTATAFILPEIFTASSTSVVMSSVAATGVAVSRIFYQKHYPSDVIAGAMIGLIAGILGIFISNRIKWLPQRIHLLIALCVFSFYLAVTGVLDSHHRHNLQFIVWYLPPLLLYLFRPYIAIKYKERNGQLIPGKLYYYIKDSLYGCSFLGICAIVLPWFTGMSGMRAPALSAGLTLLLYSYYMRNDLKTARIGSMLAFSATLMFITEFWALGYLLGKF